MKCPRCHGIGFLLRTVPCALYKCGTAFTARLCPLCKGEKTIPDHVAIPCAAAGEKELDDQTTH
jgi:hypothetical protein